MLRRVRDLLRLRCPMCRSGRMFAGQITMHAQCPKCRYVFEREPGYFLGAIAIGYFLCVGIVSGLAVLIHTARLGDSWEWSFVIAFVVYLFFIPLVFRYARGVWMYVDNWLDPPAA